MGLLLRVPEGGTMRTAVAQRTQRKKVKVKKTMKRRIGGGRMVPAGARGRSIEAMGIVGRDHYGIGRPGG